MKGRFKRVLSGILATITVFSTVVQPMTVSAAGLTDNAKEKPPHYEAVKDLLDDFEVVKATDYEMEVGYTFDPAKDFTGIEITDSDKVKVTFEEAKNENNEDFSTSHEDTYQAVYYVEPVNTEHPMYQINRKLIVKAVASAKTENSSGETEVSDSGQEEQSESDDEDSHIETEAIELTETEFDAMMEATENQETVDPETGISLSEVMEEATEQNISLADMEVGETVTFEMDVILKEGARATASQSVTVTRGSWYRYADYGLGSYLTAPYYVSWGSISATAYCVQPSKPGPGDGQYTITKLSDGKTLAKVCYYGTKASGDEGFFAEKYPDFSAGKRFIITHLAASYANSSSDAFEGTNSTGRSLAMELYNYCVSQPDIPDVAMSFSKANVKAYVDGSNQRTEEITFNADTLQTITMNLPSGVKFHNVTTGKVSAAGASVEVAGGTKFYLSAPLTQAQNGNASWSATMQGSITKEYSAYKITTGSDSQDLALVFGEGVGNTKYVDFSVSWVSQASIEIVKRDHTTNKAVAGAVYGVYSDQACTNLIATMPATDASGKSKITIERTQETVYLKEISVPTGYQVDANAYGVNLVIGGTTKKDVTNKEQLANLTVYKEGEVLTGANVTEDGVTFIYTKQRQQGAEYTVYAAQDIVGADGTVYYKSGEVVKSGLKTGADGSASLDNLHLGSYRVTETKAPDNFVCKGESQAVTLSYAGQTVEKVFGDLTFTNARQKARVTILKQDNVTKNPLAGGIYGLYAAQDITDVNGTIVVRKDTFIEKVTTGANGEAVYQSDLPINYSYYVKEIQAPANYYRNSDARFDFTFNYTNDKQEVVGFTYTFENERVDATIKLVKKDKETGEKPQGDAVFKDAVYGLYAREDIVHPDNKTGVIYPAGTQVATLRVDAKGNAKVEDLYLGKYFVKEITAPVGYLLDEKEYDLDCSYEGDLVKTVERTTTSKEQVMKQPFQVIKAANNGETDAELLRGAGFSAWLVSSLSVNKDGSYDFSSAEPIVLTADGQTEMFTDAKGHAVSIAIPYGTYVVRETTTPHNYSPVKDFIVTISENKPTEPQVWRVLLDKEFEAKLKIVKLDDETKKAVLLPNTEFKIFDVDRNKYVEQVTTYPKPVTHKSYFTDEEGYLILPKNLKIGTYRIEEVTAPDGYTINPNFVQIKVDSNTAYQTNVESGDLIIEVFYENHPVKGELTITKTGEVLTGFKKDFQYKEQSLAGAIFEVVAAEDIYTADHQKDEAGNRLVVYAKGSIVTTATTDEDGKAVVENLPLGKYSVREKNAPEGFVLNTVAQDVTFTYADQNTPVIKEEVSVRNERQKVSITVVKQDAENEAVVEGATFGLYVKEDIVSGDKVIVKADTLLEEAVSKANGKATFTVDLPFGKYYVKELKAPVGYVSSDEVLEFEATYQGQDVEVVKLSAIKKNEPTVVEITKSDITTGVELDGASLSVLDKKGNVIDEWTSEKGKPHVIKYLVVGETYILREVLAPYGYLKATDIEFTVEDTAEIQKVEMKDEVPTALLLVNKKGEFLDKITLLDNAKGIVEHFFEYISGSLKDVTFEVYATEDIKAADGVSENYFVKDQLVGTITTDENGIAKLENLPVGKYYIKEVETADGYVLDGEIRYVDLSYRDQDTPVVTFEDEWQNARQKIKVTVEKREKGSDVKLEGAIFGLYTKEDILSANGKVLLEADSLIEQKITDKDGMITFIADLPVGGKYYVKEIHAPNGYVTSDEVQEFVFEYAGADQEEVTVNMTFENAPTTVSITKTDLTGSEEIPGCKLKLTDEDGNVIEEWTSTEEAHIIEKLVVGKKYILSETQPADGYVTAENIEFTVENTEEIQKHEMKDDVTKVEISKTDITGSKELPGAKLTILNEKGEVVESWTSTDKAHYIEKLPIGKYTLREETAPEGYLVAEDISFEVKDTAEIQKVQMKDEEVPKTTEKPQTPDTPKTGDDRHAVVWLLLCLAGLAGAGSSVCYLRKKKK